MARKKADETQGLKPETQARLRRVCLVLFCLIASIALAAFGVYRVRGYVERTVATATEPPQIVLANRPPWMSDFLADQICTLARPQGGYSVLSNQILKDVKNRLEGNVRSNAWIKQIHQLKLEYTRRPGDTLVLDCEFRVPAALVHLDNYYYFVDNDGFQLPERYPAEHLHKVMYGPDGRLQFRIIEGVRSAAPFAGQRWAGDDFYAGLELAKVLYGKPYVEEVTRIDVSNFAGRQDPREAQIVLGTTRNTQIRWGRPYHSEDLAEVRAAQKLDYLQRIVQQYGRVDADKPWVDLRFDKVTFPRIEPTASATTIAP